MGYGKLIIGLPMIANRILRKPINKKLCELMRTNGFIDKGLNKKILESIPLDEFILTDLGPSSFYLNPIGEFSEKDKKEILSDVEKYKVDLSNPSSLNEWMIKCVLENKKMINVSLLDSTPCLAHEVGHAIEELRGGWTHFIQRNKTVRKISKEVVEDHNKLISFIGSLLGGSILGMFAPTILRSPLLMSEFMASYIGYNLLKSLGATEDQLSETKKCLSSAYGTYLSHSLSLGINKGTSLGALSRFAIQAARRG